MLRRLLHRLHLRHSPSVALEDAGRELMAVQVRGIMKAARETEGMTWEERVRYLLENTTPESLAYAEGVVRRSFWSLYEDDEG